MPTEILCLQLWISQVLSDAKYSNHAYFRNGKTQNKAVYLNLNLHF